MNAKKIMGAVLVALLAAALFVGAGAAAAGTVFVYQPIAGADWGEGVNGANTVTFVPVTVNGQTADANGDAYYAIIGTDIVEGEYTFADPSTPSGEAKLLVKYPTATISGIANAGTTTNPIYYDFMGGNLYEGDSVTITNATGTLINPIEYLITEDGIEVTVDEDINDYVGGLGVGTYKFRVFFDAANFADGTPENYLYGEFYTFNIVKADDATITADVDTVLPQGVIKLTITAKPGSEFKLGTDAFSIVEGQKNVEDTNKVITIPNTGKVTVGVKADKGKTGDQTIILINNKETDTAKQNVAEVDVTIEKGTITAEADAASYFVGDEITITGTNNAGAIWGYTLKGTNFEYTELVNDIDFQDATGKDTKTFEFVINTADVKDGEKKLDVGTYTLTILVGDKDGKSGKATVALVLKQPFITIIEAPEVIVKGDEAEFVIGAEATGKIAWYIFGTNYFNATGNVVTGPAKDTTNQFKFTLEDTFTADMDAGQYFMVIQHPMYDGAFNIAAVEKAFYLNTTGDATGANGESFLFNVDIRQTANAAQALCDALDTQNIDDMYVKYSFFVIGEDESFTISEIPTSIAQGETLTISGVSTSNAGDFVTVEMISTAFAAVPKETVGSAAFIAVTAQIADDGTWEVTFDTSDLNIDEYSLKVACGDKTWKNVEINVVEAADEPVTPPTDEPGQDEPGQDEPVAPETPGFGALAALAGLGAVAVLLLRRE